ncbi:MAG: hypothetical protein ACI4A5_02520 [Hominilimicola sp.]
MANYGNFNFNRKRKGKKIIIAVVCIIAVLLAVIFYIGITAGSDSEEMQRVSAVVSENTQLKEQVSELSDEISKLQKEIEDLNAQLEARPTIAPTPYAAQGAEIPAATPAPTLSPRGGIQ